MKRLIYVLSGLLVLPAFAEVAPIYYDAIEYSDAVMDTDVDGDTIVEQDVSEQATPNVVMPVKPTVVNGRTAASNRAISRAVPATGTKSVAPTRNTAARGTAARNTVAARTATTGATASRASSARGTVSRASATNTGAGVTARRAQNTSGNTVARAASVTAGARATTNSTIVQTDTVNTPLYTGRVGVRTSGITSRVPTVRMTGTKQDTSVESTTQSKADAVSEMDELQQMSDFCKAQYTQCMDNYCNVLDDNQGRCSCSANLKNYAATEAALKKATEELQDVAQKIQYIGLSSDDIETLFSQTEAELKMSSTSDSTQLKNDLDRIKGLIVDVKSGSASSSADTGLSFDLSGLLDFSISSTGFDLSSMFGASSSNTNSVSNQRGEQLYKTAAARCKASVLNSCASQGVDISLITNSYDLEIDKQCILYERSLTDTNEEMATTVRNAKSVLQKARLMVAQQKNQYDLRGCINALDACMQDEFVCGSDYENCLDPTGKWIVNGEIVTGSTPGVSGGNYTSQDLAASNTLYSVWDYCTGTQQITDNCSASKNAWYNTGSVTEYVAQLTNTEPLLSKTGTTDMMTYLRSKIGYTKENKSYGMCASVLNKCQDLTYEGKGNNVKFLYNNQVIKEYLVRTMATIKAQQDKVLADYADNCISDVVSCLSQNNYNYSTSATGTANTGYANYSDVAIDACAAVIKTCQSVTTPDTAQLTMKQWLNKALNSGYPITQEVCLTQKGATWVNNACQIMTKTLTFTFSPVSNVWISTGNGSACTAEVPNAKWDTAVSQCTTATAPTAERVAVGSTTNNIGTDGVVSGVFSKENCDNIGGSTWDDDKCYIK